MKHHIKHTGDYHWEGIPLLNYKEDGGTHFKSITRQVLSECGNDLPTELRYFEVAAGGHSTLERHEHVHMVLIGRGAGQCLVKDRVYDLGLMDAVYIPPMTWHQFRATGTEPLGFLCMVKCDRDRPQRPTEEDLKTLRSNPTISNFIRV